MSWEQYRRAGARTLAYLMRSASNDLEGGAIRNSVLNLALQVAELEKKLEAAERRILDLETEVKRRL